MKLFLIIIFSIPLLAISQTNAVKGTVALGLNYGASLHSFPKFCSIEFNHHYQERWLNKVEVSFENGAIGSSSFNNLYLYAGNGFEVFALDKFACGFSLYALAGVEQTQSKLNRVKENTWSYGGRSAIDLDYALNERFNLNGCFSQNYTHKSVIGKWFYTATIGLTLNLN